MWFIVNAKLWQSNLKLPKWKFFYRRHIRCNIFKTLIQDDVIKIPLKKGKAIKNNNTFLLLQACPPEAGCTECIFRPNFWSFQPCNLQHCVSFPTGRKKTETGSYGGTHKKCGMNINYCSRILCMRIQDPILSSWMPERPDLLRDRVGSDSITPLHPY